MSNRSLRDVGLEITTGCNLRCAHCWQGDKHCPQMLSLCEIKKAIGKLSEMGTTTIRITGGEPMIHPDFWEIMEETSQKGLSIVLRTNGTKIDETSAKRMSGLPILFVEVSIDGHIPELHNLLRGGKGSLQKSFSALRFLLEQKVPLRIKTAINKNNVGNLLDIGQLLAEKYAEIGMWSLVDLVPVGYTEQQIRDLMPDPRSVVVSMQLLNGWIKSGKVPFSVTGSALQLVANPYEAIRQNRELKSPCGYRNGYLYICADGSVKTCAWLGCTLGNVSAGLDSLWNSSRTKQEPTTPTECLGCRYFTLGICGYLYYVCPEIRCFQERKEFLRLIVESLKIDSG